MTEYGGIVTTVDKTSMVGIAHWVVFYSDLTLTGFHFSFATLCFKRIWHLLLHLVRHCYRSVTCPIKLSSTSLYGLRLGGESVLLLLSFENCCNCTDRFLPFFFFSSSFFFIYVYSRPT